MELIEKSKGGRPIGSVETPTSMVRKDLKESLQQQGEIRKLIKHSSQDRKSTRLNSSHRL